MAIMASSIIERAQTIVQDQTNVRWPLAELLYWLNDGQRELAIFKPDSTAENMVIDLEEGTLQSIGDRGLKLLRMVRNLKSNVGGVRVGTRACRLVEREVLDAQHPSWHDPDEFPYTKEVKHFCFEENDPTNFYVFPGNNGEGMVECIVSMSPDDVVLDPGDDVHELPSYTKPITVPDVYSNALLDYVLFRAYLKDADYAGNAERSNNHHALFMNSLGAQSQGAVASSPNMGQRGAE